MKLGRYIRINNTVQLSIHWTNVFNILVRMEAHQSLGVSCRGHRISIHIPITTTSPTTPRPCQPRPCSLCYQHAPTFTFQHRHSLAVKSPSKPSMTSAASQDHRPLHALQQTEGFRFRPGSFAAGIWDMGFLYCVRQSNYKSRVTHSVTGIGDVE